jgi:hypothetical protein
MLLTHYSRVTEIARLAAELKERVGELAALGRALDGRPDRGARLREGVRERVFAWLAAHGTELPPERVEELVALDVDLNAQGIEAWLDRDRRKRQP